ncbi:hypothetical protein PROH_08260 [Prochlorothrix hollandica PCC 9006 = CALU 1027]|uniref:Sulfatase-modifying factor enzyme-like domain-containing protein n=1 Tax=Prochlorothrix hollandica PCC 9006 = CALU 1027 TaxID=317619 RepID=A0A0M2Q1J8_PROHO|nr:hypothetical protein PROH_08260 [Prochlorothrix hollandica PCC 9006 = CALU 1027]
MVKIPGGEFWMGSDESDRASPRHLVKVPEFYMGKYPVTQAQWRAVAALPPEELTLDPNPSHSQGDDRPVETVSWREAREFCLRLSAYVGATYDLPTEAEWEYACRGGTETAYHFGDEITTDLANCGGPNAPQETTPVGHYGIGNRWELYDLHGNVWEWCLDPWHGSHGDKPAALQEDGSRPWLDEEIDISLHSDKSRLLRGGSWNLSPRTCRSAYRNYDVPGVRDYSYGFRVVCRGPRTP